MTIETRHLINEEIRARLKDPEQFMAKWQEGATLQELFGFSNDAVMDFYDAACQLMEEKQYEKAADAFFFIAHLAPHVKAFWLGMARSERLRQKLQEAIGWYINAIALDQADTGLYMECVRCCLAAKCYTEAISVLDIAVEYAQEHPDQEGMRDLHDKALQGKEWLLSQSKGGKGNE